MDYAQSTRNLIAGLKQGGVATLGGVKAAPGVVARAGQHIASGKPIYLPDRRV